MFKEAELEVAQNILLDNLKSIPCRKIPLKEALGQVLAETIHAPMDVPFFRKSPVDGFALCARDTIGATEENPVSIKIINEIRAGDTRKIAINCTGCGVKILTGAPIPHNLDVIIRKEDLVLNEGKILITKELVKDHNIIMVGSEIQKGQLILNKNELLSPYHIGLLASLGLSNVLVYKPPEIGLLCTGDELRFPGEKIDYGQIYNSNLYSLLTLIKSLGGQAYSLGNVSDEEKKIKRKILFALEKYDLVLTTGGASVGDYDLIEKVLIKIGAEIFFNRIAIKPGGPVIGAIKDGKLIIGLSGNPAAALIGFDLLIRPVINKLKGHKDIGLKYLEVELADDFSKKSPQRRFVRVKVTYTDDKWLAKQTNNQQSILYSMVGSNALIDIPAGSGPITRGSRVRAVLLKEENLCYHL